MSFDLTALLVFLTVVAAGAMLLRRRLRVLDASLTAEIVCLACGTPAHKLSPDSFTCPTCRNDVRARGLGPRKPRSFTGPFWRITTFSAILCAAALLVTGVVTLALPRLEYLSEDASIWRSDQPYRLIEFSAAGTRSADHSQPRPLHGEVHADLFLTTGDLFTLELQSPALRYRVTDTAGHEIVPWSAPGAFDESAALQWFAAAGLSNDDHRLAARAAHAQILKLLGLPEPSTPPSWPGGSGGGSGGYSSHAGPPQSLIPATLLFWSLAWLGGLWLILRPPPNIPPKAPATNGGRT
jgi:hypothetical protein